MLLGLLHAEPKWLVHHIVLCKYWTGDSCMVACVQPSSRLYQRLDKLLLLSEGHTMYYGEPPWSGLL